MNAGKSTNLLQSSYNYKERGMSTLVLAPAFDDRFGKGKVTSRIGIETDATTFTQGYEPARRRHCMPRRKQRCTVC